MKKILVQSIALFLSISALSQNHGNIWYFGDGAGISFNAGSPFSILNGQTYNIPVQNHSEGTSVICDDNGNLMFYTNGEEVWDRNHTIMPNGNNLHGNISSTQSALIVPKPGSSHLFYLFTTDAYQNSLQHGMKYSVVDMCLNNQNGDIIANEKNISLLPNASEKLAACKHANNVDYWIVSFKHGTNSFYAYKLSSAGISDTVTTNIGTVHQTNLSGALGQLKISPNGNKIAIAAGNGNNLIEIFDFDPSTGQLSNHIPLPRNYADTRGYGLEFSKDNTKVYFYLGGVTPTIESYISQFDLSAGGGSPAAIQSSEQVIWHVNTFYGNCGGMQLGPDDKIYFNSCIDNGYLGTINQPNLVGTNCDYQDTSLFLSGNLASITLPSFVAGYNYQALTQDCSIDNIAESNKNTNIRVYPNPFSDYITFELLDHSYSDIHIVVSDVTGKICHFSTVAYRLSNSIVLDHLSPGVYIVNFYSNNKHIARTKILKN